MLGKGHKVKDFVKRILADAGAMYEDPSVDQTQDKSSPPMLNMLIDGLLVAGEDDGEEDENMGLFGSEYDSSEDHQ
jgi:hypothetical protein